MSISEKEYRRTLNKEKMEEVMFDFKGYDTRNEKIIFLKGLSVVDINKRYPHIIDVEPFIKENI